MRTANFTCDVCGREDTGTGRWFGARFQGSLEQLTVRPLRRWDNPHDAWLHTCGDTCLLALIERYADGQLAVQAA